jgi:signal transduction histidine kinase
MQDQVKTSRFRTWLNNIPIQDPVNRQMAALLQVMLLGLIAVFVAATLVNLFLSTDIDAILIDGLENTIIFTIPLILLRRGFFQISIYYLIALLLILVTAAVLATDLRSQAETLIFFTLGILLAGLLTGWRALIITFVVSAAIVLFIALREQDPALRLDYISIAGNFILLNGLMSFFINSFGITLRNSLHASLQREEEISALNEQLHNQVAELERFTYSVSHDLRSPLVTIRGFLGMLEQDIEKDKPDKIKSDIERISGATDKMDELLSDLLELSRVGRLINPPEEIDTVQLINDAVESVDARLRSRNIAVHITPDLPTIHGDRIRLREVFENLIDNAAKYMGKQSNPVIEIGVQDQNDERVFYVKDNGLGIEEQYQEKVFILFEKLDPTIEGTGIGLALIKRIIETHGGKIWVESEGLGKGSTFCFTLPGAAT